MQNASIEVSSAVLRALSFLIYQNWNAKVKGLSTLLQKTGWPQHPAPVLSKHIAKEWPWDYLHSYHGQAAVFLSCGGVRFYRARLMLWILMLAMLFLTSPLQVAGSLRGARPPTNPACPWSLPERRRGPSKASPSGIPHAHRFPGRHVPWQWASSYTCSHGA